MPGTPTRVVHISPRVQARGGIETLHAHHRQLPLEQVFVALFDRHPEPRAGYVNLDCTWRTPLWEMRRRFRRALAPYPGSLVAYHGGWGLPLFHDLDGAARRLAVLHADPDYYAADLPAFAGLIDGLVGGTAEPKSTWTRLRPELDEARVWTYRGPIVQPPPRVLIPWRADRPLVLGYAGRVERAQKRLDLMPEFIRQLEANGVAHRFEVVGDGGYLPALRKQLAGRAHFHGWLPDEDYRRTLGTWDAVIYFSEHEGGPIVVLEAMARGALAFYPARRSSWADLYVPQVDPLCHYPPGDMPALARAVRQVFQRPAAAIEAMRVRSQELVADHSADDYMRSCLEFYQAPLQLPRISAVRARRSRLADLLPLGVVTRLCRGALRQS